MPTSPVIPISSGGAYVTQGELTAAINGVGGQIANAQAQIGATQDQLDNLSVGVQGQITFLTNQVNDLETRVTDLETP